MWFFSSLRFIIYCSQIYFHKSYRLSILVVLYIFSLFFFPSSLFSLISNSLLSFSIFSTSFLSSSIPFYFVFLFSLLRWFLCFPWSHERCVCVGERAWLPLAAGVEGHPAAQYSPASPFTTLGCTELFARHSDHLPYILRWFLILVMLNILLLIRWM